MTTLLQYLAQHLNGLDLDESSSKAIVSAAAGIIDALIKDNETLYNYLVAWCTSSSGAGLGDSVGIRRAVLAVLAQNKDGITTVFEKSMSQFGDQLYIKHAAILQQNGINTSDSPDFRCILIPRQFTRKCCFLVPATSPGYLLSS